MGNLEGMNLSIGHGEAFFGRNRRDPSILYRPVDNDVAVIRAINSTGEIKAILFSYACHNTTLPGTYYNVNGDYAAYAQMNLERMYPDAIAMFIQGCAGDIDPEPRGNQENAEMHGKTLAVIVADVLSKKLKKVNPPIVTDIAWTDLEFRPFNIEFYQKEILSSDPFKQRRAKLMIEAYNKSWNVSRYPYNVQAVRFNKDLTILALSGEVVVDYSLRVKNEFPSENLIVAGYSNEIMCYIPSKRILDEGGYEGESSMIYKGFPGQFADNVEEKVMEAIHQVMRNVGVGEPKK
jgi:hypothetical protein